MNEVRFHPFAIVEILEVDEKYESISGKLVARFRIEFDAAIDRLLRFPASHPRILGKYRWIRLRKFPYSLIYREKSQDVYKVVAFPHDRRKQAYWRTRI